MMAIQVDLVDMNEHTVDLHRDPPKAVAPGGGVYTFINKFHEFLYVGKATNLRTRISAHLRKDGDIEKWDEKPVAVKYFITHDRLESELYETLLINIYRPRYNRAKTYYNDHNVKTACYIDSSLNDLIKTNETLLKERDFWKDKYHGQMLGLQFPDRRREMQ